MSKRYETAKERLADEKRRGASMLNLLPEFPASAPWDFYEAGDGAIQFMYNDVSLQDLDEYCTALETAGFAALAYQCRDRLSCLKGITMPAIT